MPLCCRDSPEIAENLGIPLKQHKFFISDIDKYDNFEPREKAEWLREMEVFL